VLFYILGKYIGSVLMDIQISWDIGNLADWLSAIGTISAVVITLCKMYKDEKKLKKQQRLMKEEKVRKLIAMIEKINNMTDVVKQNGSQKNNYPEPKQFLLSNIYFLYDVEQVLKNNYFYDEAETIEMTVKEIEKYQITSKTDVNTKDPKACVDALVGPRMKLGKLKDQIQNELKQSE